MKRLTTITSKYQVYKSYPLSKLSMSIALCFIGCINLTACTGDDVGEVTIISDSSDKDADYITIRAVAPMALNNANITAYDLSNNKKIAEFEFNLTQENKQSDNSIDSDTISEDDLEEDAEKSIVKKQRAIELKNTKKGMFKSIDFKVDDVEKNIFVLSILTPKDTTATYYDPILNKMVSLPENKPLIALSNSSNKKKYDVLNPTPLTTLAVYRSLARVGWFYTHDSLPNPSEFSNVIQENPDFLRTYNTALSELVNSLGLANINLLPISSFKDIAEIAIQDSTQEKPSSELFNLLSLHAQIHIYKDKFTSETPYISFAHDLAKDFMDGDIDSETIYGLGENAGKTLSNSLAGNEPNVVTNNMVTNNVNVNAIFLKQLPVLEQHEQAIYEKLSEIIESVKIDIDDDNKVATEDMLKTILDFFTSQDFSESNVNRITQDSIFSYADYQGPTSDMHFYKGIGNQTLAFAIDINKELLNIDMYKSLNNPVSITALTGKYQNQGCTLTLSDLGRITLNRGDTAYTTLLDRDLKDSAYKSDSGYIINGASKDGKQRRLIQLEIVNKKIVSAQSVISNYVTQKLVNNPDLKCIF